MKVLKLPDSYEDDEWLFWIHEDSDDSYPLAVVQEAPNALRFKVDGEAILGPDGVETLARVLLHWLNTTISNG